MSFAMSRAAYDRYMGRYSDQLASAFLSFAGVTPGMRALDVGCGPGALTEALARRLGAAYVAAADPSESFVTACADRVPGADVRQGVAEGLPWPDATYDVVVSQLVMNFLADADGGLEQMCRVVRPGGTVACCTWDYARGMVMLRTFWDAAFELDEAAPDEGRLMRYCSEGELAGLWERHGVAEVETSTIDVTAEYAGFEDYWIPFTLGVGPGGSYLASLDAERQEQLRASCYRRLGAPGGEFTLPARAVAVRGRRPG
ncbi:MAG TPA: class I SAM-dependent methyltransferase [Candidatus Lustribacter sp.]|nr:class I SAM-dependent methyltransferase [Candidatus Lustribacter sp.]